MKYNTIIFDLDGTLLNTLDDLYDSVNYALKECGYAERSIDEIKRFVGDGIRILIERAVPVGTDKENIEKCLKIFSAHYEGNMENKTAPYEGIIELLKTLRKMNVKTAVCSNKFDKGVKILCDKVFEGLIDIALGEGENTRKKPSSDMPNKAIEFLKADKKKTLFVGDSDIDMQTANNAEIDACGVLWGFRNKEDIEKYNVKFIIEKPNEIIDIIT